MLEPEIIGFPEPDLSNIITEDDESVDIFSGKQQSLLVKILYTSWRQMLPPETHFVAMANVGLFYSVNEPAVVPDVMVSLDVHLPEELWEKKHRSYFIWEYGKLPEIVIEIVSNRKGGELSTKKSLYSRLGISYYIVFDPFKQLNSKLLHIFERQVSGYAGRRKSWLPVLGLGLELWEGAFEGHEALWLRWVDEEGNLLLTGEEAAEQERQRAKRLAAQLRALGVEPEV